MHVHTFQIQTKVKRVGEEFCRPPMFKLGQLHTFDSSINHGVNEYFIMNYSYRYNHEHFPKEKIKL